jgi:hypothetical protein
MKVDNIDYLHGSLELPISVGVKGGVISNNKVY